MITLVPSLILKWTGSGSVAVIFFLLGYVALFLSCFLLIAGPANKHSANDNTSGVSVLLDLMHEMPGEYREDVAFIFFDLEEMGMIGSKGYASRHKTLAKNINVINFDCVSDGKSILFAVKKKAQDLIPNLKEAFKEDGTYNIEIATSGVFYPSDQMNFNRGIGVAALNKTKRGLLYMNKIHTPRDTVYDEDNITFLKNGAIRLTEILSDKTVK